MAHEHKHDQSAETQDPIGAKIASLEALISNLYAPKHLESTARKVGTIEANVQRMNQSITVCFYISFFIVLMFIVLLAGIVFFIFRYQKSRLICQPRRRATQRKRFIGIAVKPNPSGNFSSPELVRSIGTDGAVRSIGTDGASPPLEHDPSSSSSSTGSSR